ncbi:acetylcholine receptor subunit alpha-L1-like [Saccostrea cucullata]|uniref:acetylcholine receptor subunit alpha-L1-like n=1 Tax=Saccostrea cuccullata TaxID=36930 RepID=UPI002ED1206E
MTLKYYFNVLLLIYFLTPDGSVATSRLQLFKDVLDNHDARVAPFDTTAEAIPLTVHINLMSIRGVSEREQTFSTSMWLTLGWMDHRLSWNPSSYRGITSIIANSKNVWSPSSVCIYNEVKSEKCLTEDNPVTIMNIGWVAYTTTRESVTQCTLNIRKYPFDSHVCSIYIGNLFEVSEFLLPQEQHSTISLTHYENNEEWDITNSFSYLHQTYDASLNLTLKQLHFNVEIKRRYTNVILSDLLPIILLSVLNICCFLLPIESGEKMGTSMAIFLTFAVFLTIINESMPKSDDTPYFSAYLLTQVLVSGITVVLESIVLHVHFQSSEDTSDNKVVPLDVDEKVVEKEAKRRLCKFLKIDAKKLDRIFMIAIVIINVVSLIYFLVQCQ